MEENNKEHIYCLHNYCNNYRAKIEKSSRFESITGLNLLFLLSSNLIAEFHTELELIPYDKHNNPYIKHSIQLEQYLMEGSYNKVLEAQDTAPSESYAYFMSVLLDTVRFVSHFLII